MATTFWDEFKDLFKTEKQKEEERAAKLRQALVDSDAVAKQLDALDNDYRASLPKEEEPDLEALFPVKLGLETKTYTPLTDEEILAEATASTQPKRQKESDALSTKYQKSFEKLQNDKTDADKQYEEGKEELASLYAALGDKAVKKAVKNGVSRSSIVENEVGDLAKAYESDKTDMSGDYAEDLTRLDSEIASLENERATAVKNLDDEYAEKLQKQIDALEDERAKAIEATQKYNDNVKEQEVKYAAQREKNVKDYLEEREEEKQKAAQALAKEEAQNGYSGEKLANYTKRYDIAYDFYMALDADIAASALTSSPNMRYYLGLYYDKLLDALNARTANTKKYF